MHCIAIVLLLIFCTAAPAKVVIFWQNGFPTVSSQPISRQSLEKAFSGEEPGFVDVQGLTGTNALAEADLLVMPYGSAFPVEAWSNMHAYLRRGGNLLVLGGQPFRVPVSAASGSFVEGQPQEAYSRELSILHTYEAPLKGSKTFAWKVGYEFLPTPKLDGRKFFVLEGRGLDGLGYMENPDGEKVAAPVVVVNHTGPTTGEVLGSRWVFLDFEPAPGYWDSTDAASLVRTTAKYARQGATSFWVKMLYSTLKKGEIPEAIVHLRNARLEPQHQPQTGQVTVELLSGTSVLATDQVSCSSTTVDATVHFQK